MEFWDFKIIRGISFELERFRIFLKIKYFTKQSHQIGT